MKREDLPLVTPAQFKRFKPCWLETREGCARYKRIAAMRSEWNALDVLDLEDVSACDKLWSVLRESFLPPMLLHEFACGCAEWALSFICIPDPRSVEAIRVKRRWMAGEVTDCELRVARRAALSAGAEACGAAGSARNAAERAAEWAVAGAAEWAAEGAAAWAVEGAAAWSAEGAAARVVGRKAAWEHEVVMLRDLINEWEE